VSDNSDNKEVARLERVNAELAESLKRCRALLLDCKVKLAANSNDVVEPDHNDAQSGGPAKPS
jgi:hypothetical protein